MTLKISENLSGNFTTTSVEGSRNVGMGPGEIQHGIGKLSGYNQGMNKAIQTFQEIIMVLFLAQLVQIFTHRLLHRDKPFSVTISDPFTGEEIKCWGSDRQLEGRTRRVVQLIDNSAFTIALFMSAFLFLQIYFPAYTWEVGTTWG